MAENDSQTIYATGSIYWPRFYGNHLVQMTWSPDGSTLAVVVTEVSDYSGLAQGPQGNRSSAAWCPRR